MKTRPELIESILCDDIRQEVGNKASIMGIYWGGMIFIPNIQFVFAKLCVLQRWIKGEGEFAIKAMLLSPSKELLRVDLGRVNFIKDIPIIHTGVNLCNVKIEEVGTYKLQTFLDNETTPCHTFEFSIQLPPQAAGK